MWVWLLLAQVALVSPQNTTNYWSSAHHTGDAASEQRVHGSGTTSSLCMPSSISNVYILCLLVTLVKETSQLRLKGFIQHLIQYCTWLIVKLITFFILFFSLTIFRFRVFHTVSNTNPSECESHRSPVCHSSKNFIPPESTGWVYRRSFHPSRSADMFTQKMNHSLLSCIQGGLWSCRCGAVGLGGTFGLGLPKLIVVAIRCFCSISKNCMSEIAWIWTYLMIDVLVKTCKPGKPNDPNLLRNNYLERFKALRWTTYTAEYY